MQVKCEGQGHTAHNVYS